MEIISGVVWALKNVMGVGLIFFGVRAVIVGELEWAMALLGGGIWFILSSKGDKQ